MTPVTFDSFDTHGGRPHNFFKFAHKTLFCFTSASNLPFSNRSQPSSQLSSMPSTQHLANLHHNRRACHPRNHLANLHLNTLVQNIPFDLVLANLHHNRLVQNILFDLVGCIVGSTGPTEVDIQPSSSSVIMSQSERARGTSSSCYLSTSLRVPLQLGLRRYVSLKESNVTGVIFDAFSKIKTRPASGLKIRVSKRVKCDGCHI
jgi:hypothetical protein